MVEIESYLLILVCYLVEQIRYLVVLKFKENWLLNQWLIYCSRLLNHLSNLLSLSDIKESNLIFLVM